MSKYSYLIGKKIKWKEFYDSHRGTYLERKGTVGEVKGKNIFIEENQDWKWIPFMKDIEIIETEDSNG